MDIKTRLEGLDVDKIKKRIINYKVNIFTTQTAYKLMYDYIPFDTGVLASTVDIEEKKITFKQPYAHRIYAGKNFNFKKTYHPLATAEWDKAMMIARKDKLVEEVQNYIDRM